MRWVSAATLWAAARSAPGYERKSAAFEKKCAAFARKCSTFLQKSWAFAATAARCCAECGQRLKADERAQREVGAAFVGIVAEAVGVLLV